MNGQKVSMIAQVLKERKNKRRARKKKKRKRKGQLKSLDPMDSRIDWVDRIESKTGCCASRTCEMSPSTNLPALVILAKSSVAVLKGT